MKKTLLFTLILFFCTLSQSCKPDEEVEKETEGTAQPDSYFVVSVNGHKTDAGVVINDPILGIQYLASGPKNENGKMDTIITILQVEPETNECSPMSLIRVINPYKQKPPSVILL